VTGAKLELRDVAVNRGRRRVLDVPALEVLRGELLAVVGPNGAGKSTLVQVAALLERPANGEVLFDGEPVGRNVLSYRRRMAVVFQEPLLLDTGVENNVRAGLGLRGVPRSEQRRRAGIWLERFGIAQLARRSARTLSGGEAQRTSLARALALEPEVLILDEPFAALDAPTRSALINDLDDILGESRITTIFVTHDRSEALRLGDRVAVLMDGRVRQAGTPSDVSRRRPTRTWPRSSAWRRSPGRVRAIADGIAVVDVSGRAIEANAIGQAGDEVLVCLRPEDIILAPRRGPCRRARATSWPTVRRITPAGPTPASPGRRFPAVALITKQSLEDLGLAVGASVTASFKATAVHLIPHRSRRGAMERSGACEELTTGKRVFEALRLRFLSLAGVWASFDSSG
jgi:tungstate transport system ATP-binding protein